ncbi:hypothetical protein CKAN_00344600 [Cinnamomum micranthum f. kanehirae]|uniref:Uncharacterized protein n=1 Tax=Cinnamomum micranthum f. kanehirae TaxID=337451 RepID=A0A443N979_9MAGN|nr:hypothetical protein CKAN_00344600 [Cinnamomum micranthum f. kanehirae]
MWRLRHAAKDSDAETLTRGRRPMIPASMSWKGEEDGRRKKMGKRVLLPSLRVGGDIPASLSADSESVIKNSKEILSHNPIPPQHTEDVYRLQHTSGKRLLKQSCFLPQYLSAFCLFPSKPF